MPLFNPGWSGIDWQQVPGMLGMASQMAGGNFQGLLGNPMFAQMMARGFKRPLGSGAMANQDAYQNMANLGQPKLSFESLGRPLSWTPGELAAMRFR